MQWIQHNNPGNRALHWTALVRQASENNGCDIVMWLGAFLRCKAKRGSVGESGPVLRPAPLSDNDTRTHAHTLREGTKNQQMTQCGYTMHREGLWAQVSGILIRGANMLALRLH